MRKFTILTMALLTVNFICQAQITKGSTLLGGAVNVSSLSNSRQSIIENKVDGFGASILAGKAVADNKIFGISFNHNNQTTVEANRYNPAAYTTDTKSSSNGGGIFYRSYYSLSQRFYFFTQAALNINFGKNQQIINNQLSQKTTSTNVSLNLVPGISFSATKKLYLEMAMGNFISLSSINEKGNIYANGATSGDIKNKSFAATVNVNPINNISIGLHWIFPGKSK